MLRFRSIRSGAQRLASGAGWQTALVLAFVAALVQAGFLWETWSSLLFRYPLVDAATYHQQALAILAGKGVPGAYWQAPGYLYFLAGIEWACRGSVSAARAVQALLLAPLLSVLAWRLARYLLPPAWAFAAAAATSFVGPLLFYASQFLPAFPAAVLVAAVLLSALYAAEKPSAWRWLFVGALAGLGTVTVATVIALVPALILYAWQASSRGWARLRHGAAIVLGGALMVLPVSLHNSAETGRWVWLSTNDGINFYIGNNGRWSESLTVLPGLDWDKLVRRPYEQGKVKSDAEASRWFRQLAVREICSDPAGAVRLLALKAAAFWHGRELPRNIDLYGWRGSSSLLRVAVWRWHLCFPMGLLIPLACVGAWAACKRREGVLLTAAALLFGFLVAIFFPCSRYRVPIIPVLVVMAAAGIRSWALDVRGKQWRRAAVKAGVAILAGMGANGPLQWPTDQVRYDARLLNAVGASADVCGGDLPTAKACHAASVLLDPDFADARFDLGTVYERLGDQARAEACYEAALASRPDHDKAHVNLALLLFGRGRLREALDHLAQAEALNPRNANAWYNHAAILLQFGRKREAAGPLRQAAELDVQYRTLYQRLLGDLKH